jgi:chromate transport protein ChrA
MDSSRLHRVRRATPSHIALLRRMCLEERKWIEATEFEDAIASVFLSDAGPVVIGAIGRFGFQRGVMVASRSQLGFPA